MLPSAAQQTTQQTYGIISQRGEGQGKKAAGHEFQKKGGKITSALKTQTVSVLVSVHREWVGGQFEPTVTIFWEAAMHKRDAFSTAYAKA